MKLTKNLLNQLIIKQKDSLVGNRFTRMMFLTNHTIAFALSFIPKKRFVIDLDNYNPIVFLDDDTHEINAPIYNRFSEYLRNDIAGSVLKEMSLYNNDKIVKLVMMRTNQYYEKETRFVFIELIPYHPNLIVTDEELNIIALYRESELTSIRPLMKGMKYLPPENKIINEEDNSILNEEEFLEFIKSRHNKVSEENKLDKAKEINKFLSQKIRNLSNKIRKLNVEISNSNEGLKYKDLADFLSYSREDYIDKYEIEFEGKIYKLDPLRNINQNIQQLYKKYKKSKNGIIFINEQIAKTEAELNYYNNLKDSLNDLDEQEIKELKQELNINKVKTKNNQKHKLSLNYIKYNDVKYVFGKNAIQNDYLTFEVANKETDWFHIKDLHGSHLIAVKNSPLSKEEIEIACELIILLAHQNDGDVIHSKRKNFKKGNFPGEVILNKYETIHINKIKDSTIELFKNIKKQ